MRVDPSLVARSPRLFCFSGRIRVLGAANFIPSKTSLIALFLCFFLLSACAVPLGKRDYTIGYREVGLASWYGKAFHGRATASGEIYNMFGISAAHKTMPFGTLLLVTDLNTERSVKVKVNDRGPFVGRRILDLSYGAAKKLRVLGKGIAEVEIRIIGRIPIIRPRKETIAKKKIAKISPARVAQALTKKLPQPRPVSARKQQKKEQYIIQIGAFQVRENALQMKKQAAGFNGKAYLEIFETKRGKRSYKVRMGPYETEQEARDIAGKIRSETGLRPFVLPEG